MPILSYKIEQSNRGTMIHFNRRPPEVTRTQLESVGFKFDPRYSLWVGKKNAEKAIAIAEAAIKKAKENSDKFHGTICWNCSNATGNCSWSKNFTPIDGWKAKKTILNLGYSDYSGKPKKAVSYIVKKCPEFEPDEPRKQACIVEEE